MPLSVISSWEAEIDKYFGNRMSVYIHHGEKALRYDMFKIWKENLIKTKKKPSTMQIVLTSYDLLIKDVHLFKQLNKSRSANVHWQHIIVSTVQYR